jgi:hypothetical protein
MRVAPFPAILLLGSSLGCAGHSTVKSVELLDARTGATVAVLKAPIELLPSAQYAAQAPHKRLSFAYLGPVEWNRSGTLSYGLWIHIAPGNDWQPGDLPVAAALTLMLDDGPLALSRMQTPMLGREPYQPVASWGQSAYFGLDVATLGRLAASRRLELEVPTKDGSIMAFYSATDTRPALTQYLKARGITGD